jgi:hypothetical protein
MPSRHPGRPTAQLLAFSWNRKYGPGDPGGQDIYVIDIASKHWLQITHESGSNDFPSWAPDGRHIVFQRTIGGHTQIWTMLADGTHQHQLTQAGNNSCPTGAGSEPGGAELPASCVPGMGVMVIIKLPKRPPVPNEVNHTVYHFMVACERQRFLKG